MEKQSPPKSFMSFRPFCMTTIEGKIDDKVADKFKSFLKEVEPDSKVVINIESRGGSLYPAERMIRYIYFMQKYKKCYFIVQINHAYSAALLVALMANERLVIKDSKGLIHHVSWYGGDPDLYDKVEERIFEYFHRCIQIEKPLYQHLFDIFLTSEQMLRYGIATGQVKDFEYQ